MKFFTTITIAALTLLFSVSWANSQPIAIPVVSSTDVSESSNALSLSGQWGFVWGDWPSQQSLFEQNVQFQIVETPNYLSSLEGTNSENDRFAHGIATYFKSIEGLNQHFSRPAVRMRNISEAWEAWWVNERGHVTYLGGSGKIGRSAEDMIIRDQTYILELPNDSSRGLLIVYISAFHFDRAGLYGHLEIQEYDAVMRTIMVDLASRAFLIGIGLYVVIQNLVFFFQRRKEKTLLLLSIFGLIGLLRSSFASGYVDYFILNPSFTILSLKIEYLLVIWPAVAALHYLTSIFPHPYGKLMLRASYTLLGFATLITFLIPISEVTVNLTSYQIALLFLCIFCIIVIRRGIKLKLPDSIYYFKSFIPLIAAVINDVIAAKSPGYNFYISEYALFLFLFLQTQIQASKFVSALDTAEHLTDNLQAEVNRKTQELSDHNILLQEKAQHLENQHYEIKLLSETDHLTGLFNRHTLESHSTLLFQLAQTYQQPLSLVMMDLDNFKRINDQYGHQVGDECLVFASSYLRGYNLRKRDVIARYGGEEIVIILTDTSISAAQEIIQSICTGLKEFPIQGDHPDIFLTASFGIADIKHSGAESIDDLIQFADQALYQAKQNGRDRVELYKPQSMVEL